MNVPTKSSAEMNEFEKMIKQWYPTGNRFICNPPPTDTDNDTVILVKNLEKAKAFLVADDWEICGDDEYEKDDFIAFRKGDENYIVTESIAFFMRYKMATDAAKALNLMKKEDRIALFIAVLDKGSGHLGSSGFNYPEDIGIYFPYNPLAPMKPADLELF